MKLQAQQESPRNGSYLLAAQPNTSAGPKSMVSRSRQLEMSFIIVSLLALLVSISAFSARSSDAKPLSQNQVKFRRLPPREFSALLGSSITIECEAGSSPPPTIHWLKNGKKIQQTSGLLDENLLDDGQLHTSLPIDDINRIALSSTRSRLFIDCADLDHEATYTCVAENTYSRVASNTKLNIIRPMLVVPSGNVLADNNLAESGSDVAPPASGAQAEPSLAALPQCLSQQNARSAEPARIHMWTHNIVEIMKNDIVLYCRSNLRRQPTTRTEVMPAEQTLSDLISDKLAMASAAGAALDQKQQPIAPMAPTQQPAEQNKVSWILPDDKLVSLEHRDKFEILDTGDLLIKDLRWEDMGSYVCTVSNELGSDSVSTFVYPASVKSAKSKRAALNLQQQPFKANEVAPALA